MDKFKANAIFAEALKSVASHLQYGKDRASHDKEYYEDRLLELTKTDQPSGSLEYLEDGQQEKEFAYEMYDELLNYLAGKYIL
jgi:hypothetical protein